MSTSNKAFFNIDYYNPAEVLQLPIIPSVTQINPPKPKLTSLQKWGYGILAFSLLFIGLQAIRCGFISIVKIEGLLHQLALVKSANEMVISRNATLQDKIALYSSPLGVEEMARERLGMVKKDEIIVRIFPPTLAQR